MLETIIKFAKEAKNIKLGVGSEDRTTAWMDAMDTIASGGALNQLDAFTSAITIYGDGSLKHAIMVQVATDAAAACIAWPQASEAIIRGEPGFDRHPAAYLLQAAIDCGLSA